MSIFISFRANLNGRGCVCGHLFRHRFCDFGVRDHCRVKVFSHMWFLAKSGKADVEDCRLRVLVGKQAQQPDSE